MRALCLVNTRLDLQDHLREGSRPASGRSPSSGRRKTRSGTGTRPGSGSPRRIAGGWRKTGASCCCSWPTPASAWPTGSSDSAGQALSLLDRAESIPGLPPSRALWLDRARYCSLRGETERADSARRRAEQTPATTARDHYLLATSIARQGGPEGLKAAIAELDEALRRNPRHYWSLVQRGICRLERGELVEAAADFGQCTGIWPEFAWGYFNRGCVLDRTGNKAAAVLDFTAALERDPGLVPAYVNRGLARLELKQYAPALADFDQASALGARDASVSAGRGIALEGLGRHARPTPRSRTASRTPEACLPRPARGWPGLTGLPSPPAIPTRRARPSTTRCGTTRATPRRSTVARMLAMSRGKNAEAIRGFDQALEADPGRIEARRYRAIVLARQGDWERATQEINRCLEREPRSAATLYAAACVVARAFDKAGTAATSGQALDLLERALAEGADPAKAADDPDLAAIRRLPRFQRLISEARSSAAASSSGPR